MLLAVVLGVAAPALAGPQQTRQLQVPHAPPMHDPVTGLFWTGVSPEAMAWAEVRTYCEHLPPAGSWRLPYRAELEGLFDGEWLREPFRPPPEAVLFSQEVVPGRSGDHVYVANPTNGHTFNGSGRVGYARCVRAGYPTAEKELAVEAKDRHAAGGEVVDVSKLSDRDAHVLGRADADVTLWYFYDFTCPYCARTHHTLVELVELDPGVRVVFKAAPILTHHPHAHEAHATALAAGRQGRFDEMADRLYEERSRFQAEPELVAFQLATELELDVVRFKADYHSPEIAAHIDRDLAEARRVHVRALPTVLVEGTRIRGAKPLADYQVAVDGARQ